MARVLHTITSQLTGLPNSMELPITEAELLAWRRQGASAPYIQDAFPHLTADEREFILTGVTPQEWEAAFGGLEDDEAAWAEAHDD